MKGIVTISQPSQIQTYKYYDVREYLTPSEKIEEFDCIRGNVRGLSDLFETSADAIIDDDFKLQ